VIEGGTSNRASPASGQPNPLWALTSRPAFPKISFDKAVVSYKFESYQGSFDCF